MTKIRYMIATALVAILGVTQQAEAAGFALIEQSVKGQGRAFAGEAAAAEDASTIFFNPAGLTHLCGTQYISALSVVVPYAKYKDDGSLFRSSFTPPSTFGPPQADGGDGQLTDNGARTGFIPNLYMSHTFNCGVSVGLGINAPFGLATEYEENWVGRYHALQSELVTINLNPTIAWRVNECLSFGVGFNAMYLKAKLTNAVDAGLIADIAGGTPQQNDIYAKLTGHSWGFGYNVGMLYDLDCCTRFGIAYRSKVVHHVHGRLRYRFPVDYSGPSSATLEGFGLAIDGAGAKSDVTLPGMLSFSGFRQVNACLAVLADVTWTHWHKLNELRFRYNADQSDTVNELDWRDSWRYALGVNYTPYQCVTLRSGVAYETTPIPSKEYRTPRIPDERRIWLSFGGGYDWNPSFCFRGCNLNPCIHFDVAYSHLFVKEPKIDKSDFGLTEDNLKGGIKGHYDAKTDIFAVQAVATF